MTKTFPTHWPENFETENLTTIASATKINTFDSDTQGRHWHRTGQISLTLKGYAAVELAKNIQSIPVHCASWIPAGFAHCGRISQDAETVFIMVQMEHAKAANLPLHPQRMLLNPMTIEMIRHLAEVKPSQIGVKYYEAISSVILTELAMARVLPDTFAPLPDHEPLRLLAQEDEMRSMNVLNAQWAEKLHMSERTLSRLVLRETGMTLRRWRLHLCLTDSLPMLLEGRSVVDVADYCGYASTSAFIAAFKTVFGVTPGQLNQLK